MKCQVTFDKSLKEEVLSFFGKKVDGKGFIVEATGSEQRVLTPEGEEVNIEDFAGIAKGSEVFIKSDLVSLINFSKKGSCT